MSVLHNVYNWIREHRRRGYELALAKAEARLAELERQDKRCYTFLFSDQLIAAKVDIARLKKLIELNTR